MQSIGKVKASQMGLNGPIDQAPVFNHDVGQVEQVTKHSNNRKAIETVKSSQNPLKLESDGRRHKDHCFAHDPRCGCPLQSRLRVLGIIDIDPREDIGVDCDHIDDRAGEL